MVAALYSTPWVDFDDQAGLSVGVVATAVPLVTVAADPLVWVSSFFSAATSSLLPYLVP